MAGDTRTVKIKLVVEEDTRGGDKAAETLEGVDRAAGKAGEGLTGLREESEKLDVQISKSKARVKELEEQLVRTGDRATGKGSLRQQLGSERSWLRELERTAKDLAPVVGETVQKGFLQGLDFSETLAESKGMLIAGGVALAGAMAPAIAGILSSAVVGAVGAGGVVGGAILAAQSPHVVAAWSDLGHGIMKELEPAKDAFIQPMIDSAHTFGKAFAESGLVQTLEHASKLVGPITEAIAGFGENLGPGLKAAVDAALPTWNVLAKDLPAFGSALTSMFKSLDSVGPEAALAMHDFFGVINDGTKELGPALAGLTALYSVTRSINDSVKGLTGKSIFGDIIPTGGLLEAFGKLLGDKVKPTLEGIGDAAPDAAAGIVAMGAAASDATPKFESLDEALGGAYTSMRDWTTASINVEDAFDRLGKSLEENGQNWDIDTEAGRENMRGLQEVVGGVDEAIQKKFAESQSVDDTIKTYEAYRQKLFDMLTSLGMNSDKAQELIDKWLGMAKLQDIEKFLHINVVTQSRGGIGTSQAYLDSDNPFLKGFASGGDTPAFEPFRVHTGEVMFSSRPHYVATKAQVDAMERGMGGGSMELVIRSGGSAMDDLLVQILSKAVQVRGGDGAVLGIRTVAG